LVTIVIDNISKYGKSYKKLTLYFRLWGEKEKVLVGWKALKKYKMQAQSEKVISDW
jgi:hypothetical protein